MVNTFLTININPVYVRDKSVLFTHFYVRKKTQKPGLYLQKAGNKTAKYVFS